MILDSYVKASEISLFRVHLQAVDSVTNEPVEAVVGEGPKLLITQKMKAEAMVGEPLVVESLQRGIIKATWADLKQSKETFTIRAVGYPETQVPLQYREQIDYSQFSTGAEPGPGILRLVKSDGEKMVKP